MIYKEIQKFKQPWIWVILITSGLLTTGIFGIGIDRQIVHGQKFGNHSLSDTGLIIISVLVLFVFVLMALLFGFATLSTVIDKSGISFKFFPFHIKFHLITWDAVEKLNVITYNPVRDYGGWGIRMNQAGKAYNVSGDKGLQLELKTGKRILIGTQNDAELIDFLASLRLRGEIIL